ncbi:MAG: cell wall hydrolase [Rhizobiaceae bacterium]|nr:cell wall hydrolase [Rhizobiaceae bacterium]
MPVFSKPVAFQDMTSLLEGDRAETRWQSYFRPSPAGAIETATVAFAGDATRDRLPKGAGIGTAGGVYTMDTPRPAFESPDEARVTRAQKTGRVIAVEAQAPPKAFTAGSILERQSLLRPALSIGTLDAPSTGFEKPEAADRAIAVAMMFEGKSPRIAAPEERIMVASLEPSKSTPRPAESDVAATQALGYAATPLPGESRAASLFGSILRGSGKAFVPPIGKNDHAWAATPLPKSAFSAKEQTCLANGIYFEARGENETGQAAVAQVILNRVRNPTYPNTICGVVYQNKHWTNRCQFSFACDGIKDRITNKRAFATAKRIAGEVTRGETWLADVGSATHYHATYVKPRWARAMKKVDKIGLHIFYRTYGGGWN